MNFPLLILGLYLGLLVAALALSSWAGHSAPAPDEARRVTDAAERAGLSHLLAPLRLAGISILLLATASSTVALVFKWPLIWFALTPLLVPPLVAIAVFHFSRKLLRTTGQLSGLSTADQRVALTSRATLAAVLGVESMVGLVLLGTYSLSLLQMPADAARFLVYIAGSSIGLCAAVFARATTGVHIASGWSSRPATDEPHPASLAVLVASSFHAPLLRLLGLVVLASLGHCALLAMDPLGAEHETAWLYPLILKLLGLFGLLFAGLVIRTSEDEAGSEGWVRGGLVYLILMVAGAWSLSSELPLGWARTVPAGLTFLYVALGLSAWFTRESEGLAARSPFDHALIRMPSSLLFVTLLTVLAASTTLELPEGGTSTPLSSDALMSLLLAGTLAAAPMGFLWLLSRDLTTSSQSAAALAFVGQAFPWRSDIKPSARLLLVLPLLAFVIASSALSEGHALSQQMDGLTWTLLGLGTSSGALVLTALAGQLSKASSKAASKIAALVEERAALQETTAALNFEDAIVHCRDAVARRDASWVLLCLLPAGIALLSRPFVPAPHFQSLSLGLGLGAVLLGVGLELLFNADERPVQRSLAQLGFVACLAQSLWLLTASSAPGLASSSP